MDFGNTVVIMASSIGSDLMQGVTVDGELGEWAAPRRVERQSASGEGSA